MGAFRLVQVQHAADVSPAAAEEFAEGRDDEWRRMTDTNLKGLLNATKAFTSDLVGASATGTVDLVDNPTVGAHPAAWRNQVPPLDPADIGDVVGFATSRPKPDTAHRPLKRHR